MFSLKYNLSIFFLNLFPIVFVKIVDWEQHYGNNKYSVDLATWKSNKFRECNDIKL